MAKYKLALFTTLISSLFASSALTEVSANAKDVSEQAKFNPAHAFVYRTSSDLLTKGSLSRPLLALEAKPVRTKKVSTGSSLEWLEFDDAVFKRAKKENKFVLMDLEAVWCHWCHVMDKRTYSNPNVVKLLKSKFLTVKVDQDARPDLSHKYEDYGWPATIIFDASGQEIVKRSGYIRPERMLKLLNAIIKDPSPEEKAPKRHSFSRSGSLSPQLKKELIKRHVSGYDSKYGAWGRFHKFLDWDSVEYAMLTGMAGDKDAVGRAKQTLNGQLNLMDPVWGGVYQYSTDGDWKHAHFEKIMQMQAENLRIYSIGYSLYKDSKYLEAAKGIANYLDTFLSSSNGGFYTSQDADLKPGEHSQGYFDLDDAARRAKGIPRIDKHIYARENGWAINGLAYLYMSTGSKKYLERAIKSANWIDKNRSIKSGGYSHDKIDSAGPYLGDSLAMGRAFLSLYAATADRLWYDKACQTANFIDKNFSNPEDDGAGYLTAVSNKSKLQPVPLPDQNAMLARFANLMFHYSGKKQYLDMAKKAMRYIATNEIAKRRKILVAGPLLADWELSRDPLHVTVVGSKQDKNAKELFRAALMSPSLYRRVEWYDRKEGKLPNMEVDYPILKRAAAFSCGGGICSSPKYEPQFVKALFEGKGASTN